MDVLQEGPWLIVCSKNSWIIPEFLFPGSSKETLHPKAHWVRNAGRLPGRVFSCCSPEGSQVDSMQKDRVRLPSVCLHARLYWHTPQMDGRFSASTDTETCDCEVLQNYSAHTSFTWKPWQLQVGGKWRGHVFSWLFFWTALFCVGRRNKLCSLIWKGRVF